MHLKSSKVKMNQCYPSIENSREYDSTKLLEIVYLYLKLVLVSFTHINFSVWSHTLFDSSTCLKAADEEFCKDACFEPVNSNGCPKSANEYLSTVVKKCTNNIKEGELCEADSEGKCNTSDHVDNCSIEYNGNTAPISIYRRVACCDQRSDVQKSHALPAEITAALENAGVEVFNVPLDEVIGIVGNIVGEAIEIPSDATTSEIHSEIIAALDKTGINVPEVA